MEMAKPVEDEANKLSKKLKELQASVECMLETQTKEIRNWREFQTKTTDNHDKLAALLTSIDTKAVTETVKQSATELKEEMKNLKESNSTEFTKLLEEMRVIKLDHKEMCTRLDQIEHKLHSVETHDEQITALRAEMSKIGSDHEERLGLMESRISTTETKINDVDDSNKLDYTTRIEEIENRIETMEEELTEGLQDIGHVTTPVNNDKVMQHLLDIDMKLAQLEDRGRRNNLLIYGIPKLDSAETWQQCEDKVLKFIQEKLEISGVAIERAHRLGIHTDTVVLQLSSFRDKQKIMNNAYKLSNTGLSIQEDYSMYTRQQRKALWDHFKENRSENEKCKLRYNKLLWRGKTLTYNMRTCEVETQEKIREGNQKENMKQSIERGKELEPTVPPCTDSSVNAGHITGAKQKTKRKPATQKGTVKQTLTQENKAIADFESNMVQIVEVPDIPLQDKRKGKKGDTTKTQEVNRTDKQERETRSRKN